jgi:hypothetical protein
MKTEKIEIIDRGRGPQLSTSRITVLDLIPYFHDGASRRANAIEFVGGYLEGPAASPRPF